MSRVSPGNLRDAILLRMIPWLNGFWPLRSRVEGGSHRPAMPDHRGLAVTLADEGPRIGGLHHAGRGMDGPLSHQAAATRSRRGGGTPGSIPIRRIISVAGFLIRLTAQVLEWAAGLLYRLAMAFDGLLPALLAPTELSRLIRQHYRKQYAAGVAALMDEPLDRELEPWEREVADRYALAQGRLLVLGAGMGREAMALTRRGLSVVGLDTDGTALRMAVESARRLGVAIRFLQADFARLPFRQASFDYALLASTMYSAIPGRVERQRWLRDLSRILSPGGLAVLSVLTEREPRGRLKSLLDVLNRWVVMLPGTNPAYQPGDTCAGGHFLHAFQSQQELQAELEETGITIRELDWPRGFVVLAAAETDPADAARSFPHPVEHAQGAPRRPSTGQATGGTLYLR